MERAPTARGHAQVEISAVSFVSDLCSFVSLSFMSRFERERLLFLFMSHRPLDFEAVIRVGTLSFVQFVGLLPFVCWKNNRKEEAESPRNT